MSKHITKFVSLFICFLLIFEQMLPSQAFAQTIGLNIGAALSGLHGSFMTDTFRPVHLRYLSYDAQSNNFKLLLDKGDFAAASSLRGARSATKQSLPNDKVTLEEEAKVLLKYFLIGLALPNDTFWVNLRPDSPDNIIDPYLAQTDIGRIMLETDLQLKKDTALATSPQTPEGRKYWNALYKKSEELFGYDNITIPTLTRPWIVPGEIIIRESSEGAYIYKATLKVMLEEDYLRGTKDEGRRTIDYSFKDPRMKALNEYSTQLINELIIPKLNKQVNSSKKYAQLRQVYYSLILAQWFKSRHSSSLRGASAASNEASGLAARQAISKLIDSHNLNNLTSTTSWNKTAFFQEYQKSFKDGEYNVKEPIQTPLGQTVRSYFSGGEVLAIPGGVPRAGALAGPAMVVVQAQEELPVGDDLQQIMSFASPQAGIPVDRVVTGIKEGDDFSEESDFILGDDAKGQLKNSIGASLLTEFDRDSSEFIVFSHPTLPVVIKVPRQRNIINIELLEKRLKFAKENMGGILAPFVILKDVNVNGMHYEVVIVQQRLLTFDGISTLPDEYQFANGAIVQGIHEKERLLLEGLFARGLIYNDSFAGKNYGIDITTGRLYLVDYGGAKFGERDSIFIPGWVGSQRINKNNRTLSFNYAFGRHYDEIGLPSDQELYNTWGTKRDKCFRVPDIRLPVTAFSGVPADQGGQKGDPESEIRGNGGGWFTVQLLRVEQLLEKKKTQEARAEFDRIQALIQEFDIQLQAAGDNTEQRNRVIDEFETAHGITDPLDDIATDLGPAKAKAAELSGQIGEIGDVKLARKYCNALFKELEQAQDDALRGSLARAITRLLTNNRAIILSEEQENISILVLDDTHGRENRRLLGALITAALDNNPSFANKVTRSIENNKARNNTFLERDLVKAVENMRSQKALAKPEYAMVSRMLTALRQIKDKRLIEEYLDSIFYNLFHSRYLRLTAKDLAVLFEYMDERAVAINPITQALKNNRALRLKREQLRIILGAIKPGTKKRGQQYIACAAAEALINLADSNVPALVNGILNKLDYKVQVALWEQASVYARDGIINAFQLGSSRVVAGRQIIPEGDKTIEIVFFDNALDMEWDINAESGHWKDANDDVVRLAYFPFKYSLANTVTGKEAAMMRSELNIGNRKVIVAGSPDKSQDLPGIMAAYNKLYSGLPVSERPLLIIAPREALEDTSILKKGGNKVGVRSKSRDEGGSRIKLEDMSAYNILLANTQGELFQLYAIGDVCVVGESRNILEPAVQGKAILYCMFDRAAWDHVNEDARRYLAEAEGALPYSKENLERLMEDAKYNRVVGRNAQDVISLFRDEMIPEASFEAASIFLGKLIPLALERGEITPDQLYSIANKAAAGVPADQVGQKDDSESEIRGNGGGWFTVQLLEVSKLLGAGKTQEARVELDRIQSLIHEFDTQLQAAGENTEQRNRAIDEFETAHGITDPLDDVATDLGSAKARAAELSRQIGSLFAPAGGQEGNIFIADMAMLRSIHESKQEYPGPDYMQPDGSFQRLAERTPGRLYRIKSNLPPEDIYSIFINGIPSLFREEDGLRILQEYLQRVGVSVDELSSMSPKTLFERFGHEFFNWGYFKQNFWVIYKYYCYTPWSSDDLHVLDRAANLMFEKLYPDLITRAGYYKELEKWGAIRKDLETLMKSLQSSSCSSEAVRDYQRDMGRNNSTLIEIDQSLVPTIDIRHVPAYQAEEEIVIVGNIPQQAILRVWYKGHFVYDRTGLTVPAGGQGELERIPDPSLRSGSMPQGEELEGIDGSTRPSTALRAGPSGSLTINSHEGNLGGIDFRNLPIVTQAVSNLSMRLDAAGMNRMSNVNLNKELAAFEQMTSSGITPSSQRIKEFVQASCAQGRLAQDRNKVILCIARILRDEEECCADTENTLRDLLVVLEATSSTKELKRIFVGG